ncbi:IclR family transcriptional regulator [Cytobacillus oceanisediminis]|uniref:IclR family transcriptional regulator n=1 Tax=Cytobacillus oceanisediminis TaxID=665099 RepID=A0A562JS15_9BACI|nr:IclR family transcriptional regulator [Cytobacillus oceanisediminis]TWH85918.1 IclR family transcriptional regulator [Cytobacillus oceanisediminis]
MENKLSEAESKGKRKYNVPAVDSAFKILTLLSRKKFNKSNLTEIAKATSLTPTTCYRILQKLEELSIVRYDKGSKRYSLGPYLVVLGERAKENLFDISVILPYLEGLSEQTGLTTFLVNRIGKKRSTILAKVEGEEFGINVSVGRHFSVVDGAYGKCLLAYMDEEESDELLRMNDGLRKLSEQEIIELKKELPTIRKSGYATTFGEYIEGIVGVSAPIFNNGESVEMAIAIIGMTAQLKDQDIEKMGEKIKGVATEISMKLGGYFPQ